MRSWLKFLAPLAVLSSLVGCREIKVENGEVPDKFLPVAQKYMGTYQGKMGKEPGTLTLSLQGNKIIAEFTSQQGRDILLDPRCDSKIGDVTAVKVDEDGSGGYILRRAKLAFNPNNCWVSVQGRELVLDFKEKGSSIGISASILLETEWEESCRIDPGNPAAGIPPRQVCDHHPVSRFHTGRFAK